MSRVAGASEPETATFIRQRFFVAFDASYFLKVKRSRRLVQRIDPLDAADCSGRVLCAPGEAGAMVGERHAPGMPGYFQLRCGGFDLNVRERGFFEVLRYWLVSTEHLLHEDWIPYRVSLLGNYGTDLTLKREINRFLLAEDPYGTVAFVRYGLQRGELHREMDQEMMVSILDWTMERFQDALLTEELDPGLFRRQGDPQEKKDARITQFLDVLKRAIGA